VHILKNKYNIIVRVITSIRVNMRDIVIELKDNVTKIISIIVGRIIIKIRKIYLL
jgi:hypothetical protein